MAANDREIVDQSVFFDQSVERTFRLIFPDGAKLFVSREILAMHSPIFKKHFYHHHSSSENDSNIDPKVEHFVREDVKSEDFSTFLLCICSYPLEKPVDDKNFDAVTTVAKIYEVDSLLGRCHQFLVEAIESLEVGEHNFAIFVKCASRACKMEWWNLMGKIIPQLAIFPLDEIQTVKRQFPLAVSTAIFEAKLNRQKAEKQYKHELIHLSYSKSPLCCMCSDFRVSQKCSNCGPLCRECSGLHCPVFHVRRGCGRFNQGSIGVIACVCSYTFDEEFLRKNLHM